MDKSLAKAALLDRVRREREALERLVAEVGEARMDQPGPMGAWTFKDLLSHLAAWQVESQAPLERALTGERPALPWPAGLNPHRDQDRINQHVYERTHHLPLDEVLRETWRTWDRRDEGDMSRGRAVRAIGGAAILRGRRNRGHDWGGSADDGGTPDGCGPPRRGVRTGPADRGPLRADRAGTATPR